MERYKVGDKLRLRSDLVVGVMYGNITFLGGMEHLRGEEVIIERVYNGKEIVYMLKNGRHYWYDHAMFEPKEIKESVDMINNIEVGMKLQLKDELDAGIKVFPKGTIAEVTEVKFEKKMVSIKFGSDLGVFRFDEVSDYFIEYVEKKEEPIKEYDGELGEDISKIIKSDNVIVVILESGFKGVAKCNKEDEYDFEVGKRVAYLKAKISEMQDELTTY